MKVLMLDAEPTQTASAGLVAELEAAGHEVTRCHHADDLGAPCAGMVGEHDCPVEHPDTRVAVLFRPTGTQGMTPTEDGLRCAVRHRLPVVVVGETGPYAEVATAVADVADASLVDTVTTASTVPSARVLELAEEKALAVFAQHDLGGVTVEASAQRVGSGLRVAVHCDRPVPLHLAEVASVRVAGAVRAFDRHASTVDVTVEPTLD